MITKKTTAIVLWFLFTMKIYFYYFFLFVMVMVICNTVANPTRRRYGICIQLIRCTQGQILHIDRPIVMRIRRISIVARILFLSLNWKNENVKLNSRLRRKGNAIMNSISWFTVRRKTFPKEINIKIYRMVQTGPNNHGGGEKLGLISF